jgi:hypothetical protein
MKKLILVLSIIPLTAIFVMPEAAATAAINPTNYSTTPPAFLSKCKFTLNAVPDVTNGTSIAFNQNELQNNHWTLKPSGKGPQQGGYVCILAVVPSAR